MPVQAVVTAIELATRLNEHDVSEIHALAHKDAERAGLVVAWHNDDDEAIEFRGALADGCEAWPGSFVLLTRSGEILEECEHEHGDGCRYYQRAAEGAVKLHLYRPTKETPYPVLAFADAVPHVTFLATENGKPACRGIIFRRAAISEVDRA